ncbi:PQQ-binding-like beta-propeller repeat protein [Pseudofrankia asymbiotica]|uniref:Pyrrolo-quinoline quinone n=1 Tax=Pseudofrankia asymbiotica TaxID=1834516 RepID=A0A1V2I5H5_9ACTN|nr:PQQ-binding-like beta-propeller repeat protein [Pseudofrankia asymbiotica]ONH26387.1 hypothetical protein BL253_24665 [Pseudofrankia asymbiotica]
MTGAAGLAVLLALVAVGISVFTGDGQSWAVKPVWSSELTALGPPIVVGESAIVLQQVGNDGSMGPIVKIAALDPATGRERWSAPASFFRPGGFERAVPLVVDDGETVVWLKPSSTSVESPVSMVAADADTGKERWKYTKPLTGWSPPRLCQGESAICLLVEQEAGPPTRLVLDARTGGVRGETPFWQESYLDEVGDNLLSSDRGITAVAEDGTERWTKPAAAMFGETATGLLFLGLESVRQNDVYVASVRHGIDSVYLERDPSRRIDQADMRVTAGFNATTGERLWTQPGATMGCPGIPFDPDHPARCVYRGALRSTRVDPLGMEDYGVTLEGFDLATGRTTWSWDAGDALVLLGLTETELESQGQARDTVQRVGDSRYVLRLRGETTVLDLDRGPVSAEPPATGWCLAQSTNWSGVGWPYPCTVDGSDATPPSPVGSGGAFAGGHYVWLDKDGRIQGGALGR